MAASFVAQLKPDLYNKLPYKQSVQSFFAFLKKKGLKQSSITKSCFLKLNNLNEAYLAVACCFGGPQIVSKINPYIQKRDASQKDRNQIKQTLHKIIDGFNWNINLQVFQMFEINSKLFGNRYPFFSKNIFPCFLQKQSQSIFMQIANNFYLQKGKIRIWQLNSKNQFYRKYARGDEKEEQIVTDYSTYILLAENKNGSYNLGSILINQIQSQKGSERGSDRFESFQVQQYSPPTPILRNSMKKQNKVQVVFSRKNSQEQRQRPPSRVIKRTTSKTFNEHKQKYNEQKDIRCPCQLI